MLVVLACMHHLYGTCPGISKYPNAKQLNVCECVNTASSKKVLGVLELNRRVLYLYQPILIKNCLFPKKQYMSVFTV